MKHTIESKFLEEGEIRVYCTVCDWVTTATDEKFVASIANRHRLHTGDWPFDPSKMQKGWPNNTNDDDS